MVMSSKTKVGLYTGIKKPVVKQCAKHGMPYLESQGCVYCRVNEKPDPLR